MSPWIIFILFPSIYAIGNPRYECGDHGRFEYCIDGFPGCIVGCHCHPGHYFDTETKICEPNAKLVEEYRRLYVAEPTRVPIISSSALSQSGPTPTTTTTATEPITRDTDDLGDWLYNQFFKTIETQVINNTNKSKVLTRRSGSDLVIKKPKRLRRYKKFKSTSKRAKKKNDDLRRKLLRITEDDSLFDSTFDSDSGDSSSYSESMSIEENPSIHVNTKDHDQRKLIIFNKKPKMPLPSFVFLPNYETPFYPPLGLPMPPPMPMYPMVPVPPMPVFPCPEPAPAPPPAPAPAPPPTPAPAPATTPAPAPAPADASTTQSTTAPTEHTTIDSETVADDDEKIPDDGVTTPDDGESKPEDDVTKPDDVRSGTNSGKRKKLLQKLRERMRPPNIKINMTPPRMKKKKALRHRVMKMKQEPEMPYTDDYMMMDPFAFNEATEKPADDEPLVPTENDVDFKYLAQLIHRVDPKLLNSKDFIKHRMQTMEQAEEKNQPIFVNQPDPENRPTRRLNGNRFLARPNEPDDSYYSNLGQQIAALIRKLDSTGHRNVDIEVDTKHNAPAHPVFNENNFASRSYWERSVRSPLQNIPAYTDEDYPQTNYRNLLNIENKVENVATTVRTFSLNDLENVVNLMGRANLSLRRKNTKSTKQAKGNLNVNLLPRLKERVISRKYSVKDPIDRNNVKSINKTSITGENIPLNPYLHGVLMNNFKHIETDVSTHDLLMRSFGMIPDHDTQKNRNHTSIKKNNPNPQVFNTLLKKRDFKNTPDINHIKNASMISHILSPVDFYLSHLKKPRNLPYQLAPLQKYENRKYYHDKNKHYVYEKESIPIQLPQDAHNLKPIMPSYFHHEMHHFDYFE